MNYLQLRDCQSAMYSEIQLQSHTCLVNITLSKNRWWIKSLKNGMSIRRVVLFSFVDVSEVVRQNRVDPDANTVTNQWFAIIIGFLPTVRIMTKCEL